MSSSPEADAIMFPFLDRWNDRFICTGIELGEKLIGFRKEIDQLLANADEPT